MPEQLTCWNRRGEPSALGEGEGQTGVEDPH